MRVNGALLGKCINQRVSLMGTVQSINPSNSSFSIQTSDGKIISVNLSGSIRDNITGLVEVHGISSSHSAVNCDYYLTFPYTIANTYDADLDNEAVNVGFIVANAWK